MTTTAAAPPRAPVERAAPLLGVRPNAFAAPLGILGLAGVWRAMQQAEGWPGWVADALCRRGRRESPFSPLPFIVLMLLAATGLASHASGAADVLLAVGLTCSLLLGAWLTGEWVAGPIDPRRAHPGYFIPALGPGMIGALTAGTLGHANLAWMCLGLGLLSWIMLGSVILHRLMFGPELPAPLGATLAIEIAPPAVAATAYLTLDGGRVDPILLGLSGFCVLMVLGQVRLLPIYRRVPFFPNWWAFTFSWAAVINLAIRWLALEHPAGQRTIAAVLTAVITAFIGAIAVGSVLVLARRVRA